MQHQQYIPFSCSIGKERDVNSPWLVPLAWHRELPSRCRSEPVAALSALVDHVRRLDHLRTRPSSAQLHANQRQALVAHQFVDENGGRCSREYSVLDGRRLEGEAVLPRDNHAVGSF